MILSPCLSHTPGQLFLHVNAIRAVGADEKWTVLPLARPIQIFTYTQTKAGKIENTGILRIYRTECMVSLSSPLSALAHLIANPQMPVLGFSRKPCVSLMFRLATGT